MWQEEADLPQTWTLPLTIITVPGSEGVLLWEIKFKKAVIPRYSWQLSQKKTNLFSFNKEESMIQAVCRMCIYHLNAGISTGLWCTGFPQGGLGVLFLPTITTIHTQTRNCPTGKFHISNLPVDISNEGMQKISVCPNFTAMIPALASASVQSHVLITCQHFCLHSEELQIPEVQQYYNIFLPSLI